MKAPRGSPCGAFSVLLALTCHFTIDILASNDYNENTDIFQQQEGISMLPAYLRFPTPDAASPAGQIVTSGDLRFTVLTSRLIRIERGGITDAATLTASTAPAPLMTVFARLTDMH